MMGRRAIVIGASIVATAAVVYCGVMLIADHVTDDRLAEKVLRALRPRLQQYADENGRLPHEINDIGQPEIVGALRSQAQRAGFELRWLQTDDRHGVVMAVSQSGGVVAKAFVAQVNVNSRPSGPASAMTSSGKAKP